MMAVGHRYFPQKLEKNNTKGNVFYRVKMSGNRL